MRKLGLLLLSVLISAGAFAQNTLHLATSEDWETLDPAFASGVATGAMVAKIYDGLMRYDYNSVEVVPNLAEDFKVNDDATAFTFTLHDGVTFSNGTPLTAEDVKYSFERVLDPDTASPVVWVFGDAGIVGAKAFVDGKADEVSGIEVVDPRTIRITLERPYALFLYHLAMPAAHIVSKAVAGKLEPGADLSANPVGSGPFTLADRVRDSSLTLSANENYFAGTPKIDGVEYRIITDPLITWNEFLAGNLDVSSIPTANFNEIVNDPQYENLIETTPELAFYYLALNQQKFEPFKDVRVRRAIAMAIDRQGIIDGIYNGTDILANGPIPPGLEGYTEQEGIPYDPEGARQLLAEAGYADGFDLTLWSTRTETTVAVNELIQFFLGEVGIRTEINQVDFGTLLDAAIAGRAPAYYLSWFADYGDAYNFLHPLFVARAPEFGYDNPEVTKLLAEAATKADLEARVPLYQEAEKMIIDDAPMVFIRYPVSYYAVKEGVTGILNHPIFNADKFMTVELGN